MNAQLSSGGPDRPSIAFAMGDPAGISPELAAELLASHELAQRHGSSSLVMSVSCGAERTSLA